MNKNNLDRKYLGLLEDILENGVKKGDRTGTGTISVFGREIRHNMSEGFPLLTSKRMYTKGVIVELIWFLNGGTNIQYLVKNGCNIWNGDAYKKYVKYASENNSKWNEWMKNNGDGTLSMFTMKEFVEKIKTDDKFAEIWGDLGPIYGKQWRKWTVNDGTNGFDSEHVDQIANLLNDLKNNPDSRRLMVNAWNIAEVPKMTLPPCHYGFECWTRELNEWERGRIYDKWFPIQTDEVKDTDDYDLAGIPKRELSLRWIQRSCDFPLGIPFNIASYGFLLTMLAQQCNMVPGELIGSFGDSHIYQNQIEGVKEQILNQTFELPILELNKATSLYDYKLEDFDIIGYENAGEVKYPLSN